MAPPIEGSPCWVEIPARDIEKLKSFYSTLFPSWEFKEEANYGGEGGAKVAMYNFKRPEGFGGGIVQMPTECGTNEQHMGSGFTLYYLVDDLEKTLERINELGGSTVMPKVKQGESGWFANAKDVEGNRFGIYELHLSLKG